MVTPPIRFPKLFQEYANNMFTTFGSNNSDYVATLVESNLVHDVCSWNILAQRRQNILVGRGDKRLWIFHLTKPWRRDLSSL